jgi:cold-inducible RNA-binding protein
LTKKLYVGNLSFAATETQIREMFEEHGSIQSLSWVTDRDTGRVRGFATMKALDGQMVDGRELRVNEARPKTDKRSGGGGGGGRRGGYSRGW